VDQYSRPGVSAALHYRDDGDANVGWCDLDVAIGNTRWSRRMFGYFDQHVFSADPIATSITASISNREVDKRGMLSTHTNDPRARQIFPCQRLFGLPIDDIQQLYRADLKHAP